MDAKQNLRKLSFPVCVKEALNLVEQLCTTQNMGRMRSLKQTDSAMELIAEFVFCEIDRRGNKKKRLNSIQELQLLEILSDYFQCSNSTENTDVGDATRNTVFMSLFPSNNVDRCQIFIKLVSTAIATSNIPLLTSTGVLMQQFGCTSKFTAQLAKGIINDYFVLLPRITEKLNDLPVKAALFSANFLLAVTEVYYTDFELERNEPPVNLLKLITYWISEYPSLCLTALLSNLLPALPHGAIPMPAITPFIGLLKWCVFAPLYGNYDILYSSLHFAVLKSLLQTNVHYSLPAQQRNIISAQHLTALVACYSTKLTDIFNTWNSDNGFPEKVKISLERLTLFIQVALSTESIYGSKQELFYKLSLLPKVRALQIVLTTHKEIV